MIQTAFSRGKSLSSGSRTNKLLPTVVIILLVAASLFFSCTQAGSSLLPDAGGKTGEVLVVMPREQWNGNAGEVIRKILSAPYTMLPQYEPVFDYFYVDPQNFREFLLLHRNIILADINEDYQATAINFRYNERAHNQIEIIIKAPDINSFSALLIKSGEKILATLEEIERKRLREAFRYNISNEITERINKKHGVSLTLPEDWEVAADTSGFTWLMKESGTVLQGIFVYSGMADSIHELTDVRLTQTRDSVLKAFVPGSSEGSYMTTEKEFPPAIRNYSLNEQLYVAELRGLWKTANGISMGGPFMSISFMNADNTFTTVEGFVFAAGYDKRDYMREVESIVTSTGFP